MKVYFAGSIRAGRVDVAVCDSMISYLRSLGEVLTEFVSVQDLSAEGT